ncbi:hypothetical protein D3C76_1844850 [compost metagenome]
MADGASSKSQDKVPTKLALHPKLVHWAYMVLAVALVSSLSLILMRPPQYGQLQR